MRAEEIFDGNSLMAGLTQQGRIWQAIVPTTLFRISLHFFLLSSLSHLAFMLLLETGIRLLELLWKPIEI